MNGGGKSDWPIVPEKPPNNARGRPRSAEGVEGSGQAKGNLGRHTRYWTQHQVRRPPVSAQCAQRATRNSPPVTRSYPRQEPSAVIPHAGICAGGGPQGRFLP